MKFFALVVATSVAVVAWLQWWVARNKQHLFDRRWQIYDATRTFVRMSIQDYSHIDQLLHVFNDETAHAEFLFGNDVLTYLEKIRSPFAVPRTQPGSHRRAR